MTYSNEIKVAVAVQLAAMIENNIIQGCGIESFEGWCEDGDVFDSVCESAENPVEFIQGCTALMREISPVIDRLSEILEQA